MPRSLKILLCLAIAQLILHVTALCAARASDNDLIPPQLPRDQRENLLRFLRQHEKPASYVPRGAKVVGTPSAPGETDSEPAPGKPIRQFTVQITPHRPVPGQEDPKRVDVVYYRPNPVQGKPGITVRHTVDLTTGSQIGPTEVLLNHHIPLSREEIDEAVALARAKSAAVQELYKERDSGQVHWEFLQIFVSRKHEQHEPGDRVVRFVFTAPARAQDQRAPKPVRTIVNLTKGIVVQDAR
jgi:hypothetical protein